MLTITVTWTTWATAAPSSQEPQGEGLTREQARERLDRYVDLVEQLRSQIDRSQFDLEALLARLDYDADEIVSFVTEEIQFEQYPGLLRAARGTLMSRAGNALDQSVLLATLLNDAGYEARIVRRTITRGGARTLVSSIAEPAPEPPAVVNVEDFERVSEELSRLATSSGSRVTDLIDSMDTSGGASPFDADKSLRDVTRISLALAPYVSEDALAADAPELELALVQEATDYFWVQFREAVSSPWRSTHPAFPPGSPIPDDGKFDEVLLGSIPEDLHHRVRFQAFVERRLGARLETHAIMEPWERPAANLVDAVVTFWNAPSGFAVASTTQPQPTPLEAIDSSSSFLPVFNGDLAPGAQGFDLLGNVVPPDALASPMAGIFQQVGAKFGDAAGALSDGEAQARLTRQWVEIALISPDGATRVLERDLARRRPNEPDLALKRRLARLVHLGFSTGRIPNSLILDQFLEQVATIASHRRSGCCSNSSGDEEISPLAFLAFFRQSDDVGGSVASKARVYRSEPHVVATYQDVWLSDTYSSGVDILSNGRRAVDTTSDALRVRIEAVMSQGVADTVLEAMLLPPFGSGVVSAAQAIEAQADDSTFLVIKEAGVASLGRFSLDKAVEEHLQNDLRRGYWIVVPSASEKKREHFAWWRVDPRTGDTLGMLDTGWGGALMQDSSGEYQIIQAPARGLVKVAKSYGRKLLCLVAMTAILYFVFKAASFVIGPISLVMTLVSLVAILDKAEVPNAAKIVAVIKQAVANWKQAAGHLAKQLYRLCVGV